MCVRRWFLKSCVIRCLFVFVRFRLFSIDFWCVLEGVCG